MTNIEFAEKIKGYLKGSKAKAKKYEDTVAVNFTFIDDMDDFYVAVREGVLDVAPYHYDDLQANVTGAAENIEKLFSGDVSFDGALTDGLVKVDGDVAKFKALEALVPAKKAEKPVANVGDTVRVHVKIKEGSRERIQVFEGIVIAKKHGGLEETFTVRRLAYGVGVEKVFPVHSPLIEKVETVRSGYVRRAKLYYLRDRVGKAAKIREKL